MKILPIHPLPPAASSMADAGPWRLAHLMQAPHRLAFAAGATMLAVTAHWWALASTARHAGIALPWAVAPTAAHGVAMALGFMPLFIAGFAFTAAPRWLGVPEVCAQVLRKPLLLILTGWALALPGFHLSLALAAAGLAAVALGWSAITLRSIRLLRASLAPDKLHATWLAATAAVGVLALWAAAGALALGLETALRTATSVALWGFLVPLFVTVAHRMLPFFTANVLPLHSAWRPDALLWAMLAAVVAQLPFAVAEWWWWPLPAWVRWWQVGIELPAALLLRLASALWPAAGVALLQAAVVAWVAAMLGWALRYGRWLGRPRADGRPG